MPLSECNGRKIGSGVVCRLDDGDCCAVFTVNLSAFKLVFAVVDGASALADGSEAGETERDGIVVLVSVGFGDRLIFRSSVGSVDAGRLSLSVGSSMIGEYDLPTSAVAETKLLPDVVGISSVLASVFCFWSDSFVWCSVVVQCFMKNKIEIEVITSKYIFKYTCHYLFRPHSIPYPRWRKCSRNKRKTKVEIQ